MKGFFYLALFLTTSGLSAQTENVDWVTDYKSAITAAKSQDQLILAYFVRAGSSDGHGLLERAFFKSEMLQYLRDRAVFLKLNITNNAYAKRMAVHYTGNDKVPAIALIDANQKIIGEPLVQINADTIANFMSFLKSQIK